MIKVVKTAKFQKKLDYLIDRTTLQYLPISITPNLLTLIRLALVPIVFLLLKNGLIKTGLLIFALAAYTDAMDGAMARSRDQITDFGKLMDPIADKLLIGSVLLFIGWEYLIVKFFLAVIIFEVVSVIISAIARQFIGRPIGANIYGKIKMILQCLAIVSFLIGLILKNDGLIRLSEWTLVVALLFAFASGVEQLRRKLEIIRLP